MSNTSGVKPSTHPRIPLSTPAESFEEIIPLIRSCKAGNLNEVESWIKSTKPVDPPPPVKGRRKKGPLQIAVDAGFYSVVEALLKAGAAIEDSRPFAMESALRARRLDIVKLLIEYGSDPKAVDLHEVFETWQPEIIDYFIEMGADIETGNPLAAALCDKIRTALGVYKRHHERFPQMQDQLDIALRFHCREGDVKWASLLLWAGADPYAKGPESPYGLPDLEEDMCAVEWAVFGNHPEIFDLKQISLTPDIPVADELLMEVCRGSNADFLLKMLDAGFEPIRPEDHGSRYIRACFSGMDWPDWHNWYDRDKKKDIDNHRSREKIKMIYALAKHGVKWNPANTGEIEYIRKTLLKMKDDYTVEFAWIMSKFNGCKRESMAELFRTPSIRKLVVAHKTRLEEILSEIPE